MIINLGIRKFAILENWIVDFSDGMSVFTGETGAGKSLFVDALNFVTGARAQSRFRREGAEEAVVEAAFSVDERTAKQLSALGCEPEDGILIFQRMLNDSGSQARMNRRITTISALREASALLMDIHAQNAQSLLADRKNYLNLLDEFAGPETEDLKAHLATELQARSDCYKALDKISMSPEETEREADLLRYQMQEIADADLPSIDEEALNTEYRLLSGAQERAQAMDELLHQLEGGHHPIHYAMQEVARDLDHLQHTDAALQEEAELAWQIEAELDSLQENLEQYRENIRIDPPRMEEIDAIFQRLQGLRRKYGSTNEEVLQFAETCRLRLHALEGAHQTRQRLQQEIAAHTKASEADAAQLHQLRRQAGDRLQARIKEELTQMAIKKLSFSVSVTGAGEIGPNGGDTIDFLISTNPGEPMHSISEVASGGEMSRFMLAFKIVLAEVRQIGTLVFDEIDTGISGRTAQVVAEKLARLARTHQVLVITHLPQIAAVADHHFLIRKQVENGTTYSQITQLDAYDRIEEQARLIGGAQITNVTRDSAREMIQQAQHLRKMEREGGRYDPSG
uniref:DNA repair protein RecN n=1 Tax=Ndongobacter massiliensis TaxID=1871025 RepID=UPI0009305461|nr:DNA repair protein RecN [Ndongobacter massiliensis]